jgi:hypothetical protein
MWEGNGIAHNKTRDTREICQRRSVVLHKVRGKAERYKEYYKYDGGCMEDLLSATTLELSEVTRTRDDRESSPFRLESDYYYDDDSEDHEYDIHIYEMKG